jgi:hypothetical protein
MQQLVDAKRRCGSEAASQPDQSRGCCTPNNGHESGQRAGRKSLTADNQGLIR